MTTPALKRIEHWATRAYHQFLLSRAKTPFAWGVNDCCLFPADGILAITGIDVAVDFRGKYSTQAAAFATIKTVTGGSTVNDAASYVATKFGMTEYSTPLLAHRGDLVTLEDGGNLIAGLVHLNGRDVVTVGENGVVRCSLRAAIRAWRVG
jgi:hypothetical protein